jgi:hypothetical protein
MIQGLARVPYSGKRTQHHQDGTLPPPGAGDVYGQRVIYRNTLGYPAPEVYVYSPGWAIRVADDLFTEAMDDCALTSVQIMVNGGVQDGNGVFAVRTSLWNGCPWGGGQQIEGTETTFYDLPDSIDQFHELLMDFSDRGICNDGVECRVSLQDCDDGSPCLTDPLIIPSTIWLRILFTTGDAGVVVGTPAQIGFSTDTYDHPQAYCRAWYGGWPDFPHTSFWAELYAVDDCPPQFLAYLAAGVSQSAFIPPGGTATRVSDDIELVVDNCEVSAYELGVIGSSGPFEMSIDLRRVLTNDPDHPEHPDNPGSLAAQTAHIFQGSGEGSLELARFEVAFGFMVVTNPSGSLGERTGLTRERRWFRTLRWARADHVSR